MKRTLLYSITALIILILLFVYAGAGRVAELAEAEPLPEIPIPLLPRDVASSTEEAIDDVREVVAGTKDTAVAAALRLFSFSATSSDAYPLMKVEHTHASAVANEYFPDLRAAANTKVLRSGTWSEIFPPKSLPRESIVHIPPDVTVTYDLVSDDAIEGVVVEGTLVFDPSRDARLSVGTIMVYPGGRLEMRPTSRGTRAEIVFDWQLDKRKDPTQLTAGLLAIGGEIDIAGTPVSPAFSRAEGAAGVRTLVLSDAAGFRAGDKIALSGSRDDTPDPASWRYGGTLYPTEDFPGGYEEAVIESIRGATATLVQDLLYDHDGYAASLSRNVVIRSKSQEISRRGHILLTGDTDARVENALIADLGRTTVAAAHDTVLDTSGNLSREGQNQRGRYAFHVHHIEIPFTFSGNVILRSPRWGIVNHASYGNIRSNVIVGAAGSGIVGEDGVETGTVSGNLVIGNGGGSGDDDDERFGRSEGRDIAHGGFGYWFRGPFLEVTDNVAAGYFPQAGFLYFVHPGFVRNTLPRVPGMPEGLPGLTRGDLTSRSPIRLFSGNRAEGHFGNHAFGLFYSLSENEVSDFTVRMKGQSSSEAILARHSELFTIRGGTLSGGKEGAALIADPKPENIRLIGAVISNFKNEP